MSSTLDLNQYLFLKKINTTMQDERSKAVELHRLFTVLKLEENFFLHTIKQLEKQKLVKIGFYQRNTLLHIVNWAEKYASSRNFYVSLTKKGQTELSAW